MIRLTLTVLTLLLLAIAAHAQTVPSSRPPTLGVGLTDGSGSCNTGTQQAVSNIAQQGCVQGYTANHTVALVDGVLSYAANGGSSVTFTLARATSGDGAQGVGYCFADWTHHGYTLATATSTFTGSAGVSGSSQAFPADTFVCAQSDGADHWTLEVVWGDMARGAGAGVSSLASGSSDLTVAGTGGGPFTGAATVTHTKPLRSQAGGSIVAADGGKIVYNTGGTGITLPVHTTTGFGAGFATTVLTDGTAATITVTTDDINGNTTVPLGIKQGIGIVGDGTGSYKGLLGMPSVVASGVLVSSAGRVPSWQAGTSSQLVLGNGALGTLGTAAAVNTGTSGATIPLLNGNWTESGNVTFSGTILASGLSSGTCSNGISLDSGNNIVKISCPAGSGLSGMTTGQLGVAGGATSITSSVPFGLTGNSTIVETTSGGLLTQSLIPPATLATGTSVSLTAPKQYYVCTGTCTVTPPVPAAGYEFCVMNDNNVATVITLAALGSSAMYENTARTAYGTAGTGTLVSTGAVGNEVCIVGRDSTHYLTPRANGSWTAS